VSLPTTERGLFSVEFFDLQLRFAARVAELSGLPFTETVGSHTNVYVRLGMGPQLDTTNPEWLQYLSVLDTAHDPAASTHELHRKRAHLPSGPVAAASVGCFSYAYVGPDSVRLHFHAASHSSDSPLSLANARLRRWEIRTLLSQVASLNSDLLVVGASWLYNLRSYRRLFPEPYLAGLSPLQHPYQRMPLWGQFLNRDRSVRAEAAHRFRSSVADATSLVELAACFPLQVLTTSVRAKLLAEYEQEVCNDA
jgi:hypothetical protein